jgi:hypothetical protein
MSLSPEEHELVELTRFEKVLALGLTIFLLVGGLWVLERLNWAVPGPSSEELNARLAAIRHAAKLDEQQGKLFQLEQELSRLEIKLSQRTVEYEFRREEYRTALDAGRDDPVRRAAYQQALAGLEAVQEEVATARAVTGAARETTRALEARVAAEQAPLWAEFARQQRRRDLMVFLLRLAYAGPVLALTVWGWSRLRSRRSQYLLIGTSLVGFGIVQAVFLVGGYAWTLFRDVAQLAVSIGGSVITIAGLVAMKRYAFDPSRVGRARLRKGRCPRCAYPVRPEAVFCADCGERLAVSCPACGALRPSALPVCPSCGDRGRQGGQG